MSKREEHAKQVTKNFEEYLKKELNGEFDLIKDDEIFIKNRDKYI